MSRPRLSTEPGSTNYRLAVVSFSVVREGSEPHALCSSPADVATVARALIPDDAREHFGVLMLDARNGLIAWHAVSQGTLSASLVHPREVFGPALRLMGVASLILVHNHPSGDPTPSREDVALTRKLAEGARLLDLSIHDHVILGDGTGLWASLSDRGML